MQNLYSIKNEENCDKIYGRMSPVEAVARVKKYMNVSNSDFMDKEFPLLHNEYSDPIIKKAIEIAVF